jgi:hypothetical protein
MLALAALLAVVFSLPSVVADFYCDDQIMVLRLEGTAPSPVPGPFSLYTFASGAADQRARFVEHGGFPWWTSDGLRLAFFRPLSSALFALDHALAGRHPLPYHLHSLAWYVLAVIAAALLFRRLLPEREAMIAALLFAVAPAHWMLAAWPSARHVAVSGAFGLASIGLYPRARDRDGARPSPAALACAAASLAGGETGLGIFAYVLAHEVFGRREPLAVRLRALAPWGALFAAYAAIYRALGCGVAGSAAYVDPIASPRAYLSALPARLAVFADAALLGLPSEISAIEPRAVPLLAALGVAASVALAALLRRALRQLDEEHRRTVRWLLAGAVLAVLPGVAGIPGDRVLFMSNLGVTAALAVVLVHAGRRGSASWLALLPARAGVALFGVLHVVAFPLLFAYGGAQLAWTSHAALAAASTAEIPVRPGVRLYGIGLSDPLVGMYLGPALWIAPRPEPRPREVHLLTMSPHRHRIARTDDRTLTIAVEGGTLLEGAFETVVRSGAEPLHAGDVVPYGAATVRIVADEGGRPTRIAVTFDRPLDDPSIVLVAWQRGALRTIPPPAPGAEVVLSHEVGPMGI